MKKTTLFILCQVLLANSAYSDQICRDNHGVLRCGSGEVHDIYYRGFVELYGTHVKTSTNINGNLLGAHTQLNSLNVNGQTNLTSSILKGSVRNIGNTHFQSITFYDKTKLTGNCSGESLTFLSSVKITGATYCNNCIFKKETTLIGEIELKSSQVNAPMKINAKLSKFNNSKLQDIYVKRPSKHEPQTIELSGNTIVHDISFESNKGLVLLYDNASISGSVKGGLVKKS